MGKDKSILEKITGTVKDIATIAADAASHALKAEEPPRKTDEQVAAYMPLAADGLVSDPMMVPPIAMAPAKRRRAPKRVAKKASKKNASKATRKAPRKSAGKAARKSAAKKRSAAKRSKQPAKKAVKKSSRKSASKAAKKKRKRTRG
jgi:hypothetical protein